MLGNSKEYDLDKVEVLKSSPLNNKRIGFLGSSITYGSAAEGISFVEYISKRNNCSYVKEAVSGTTLVDSDSSSYVSRMKTIDKNERFDLFVVQLSSNDASQNKELGDVNDKEPDTICGAINYIIQYVRDTWHCPVVFYNSPKYESENYKRMVAALNKIKDIQNIVVIDMYNDEEYNNITPEERSLYMADGVHPTKAGYLKWWTPRMEKDLYKV